MKTLKFYIGERNNPQLSSPYYKMYGQLTIKEAKKKEDCVYGSMDLTSYDSEESYNKAIKELNEKGCRIS